MKMRSNIKKNLKLFIIMEINLVFFLNKTNIKITRSNEQRYCKMIINEEKIIFSNHAVKLLRKSQKKQRKA